MTKQLSSDQSSALDSSSLTLLNNRLWMSYKSLGNEITVLGESVGHELRLKSKDSNRAVVSCCRSGIYSPLGQKRCTSTIKCNCPFKINLKKDANNHWKVYNYHLEHNHEISLTAGLIKSYKKLSTIIWNDLKVGIMNGIVPKVLITQIKESHPLARKVTDLVFKNAIQKIKRDLRSSCKSEMMKIQYLVHKT